jgi:hypothetical protein
VRELSIGPANGVEFDGTRLEISQSGFSLASANYLRVGEVVELCPILTRWVRATVNQKNRRDGCIRVFRPDGTIVPRFEKLMREPAVVHHYGGYLT